MSGAVWFVLCAFPTAEEIQSSALSFPSFETVAIATKTKNPLFQGNVRGNHENKNCVCLYIHCVLDYHTHYTKKVDFFVLVAMATVSGLEPDSALITDMV